LGPRYNDGAQPGDGDKGYQEVDRSQKDGRDSDAKKIIVQ